MSLSINQWNALQRLIIVITSSFSLIVIVVVTSILLSTKAEAHEIRPAIIDLSIEDNGQYQLQIRLNLEAIIAQIGPEHSDTSESINAEKYNILRSMTPDQLTEEFNLFKNRFLESIHLKNKQERLSPTFVNISIPNIGDTELARDSLLSLHGKIPTDSKELVWAWNKNFGANILRVKIEQESDNSVLEENKQEQSQSDLYSVYLKNGDSSDPIAIDKVIPQVLGQVFTNYLLIGFEHIIPKGLDHILFVIGLFLLSLRLRPLLWQITSFTLAHSVTLALGILGFIQIPASIVEPLIALSIVYVAVENLFSDKLSQWRPVIIFIFGLLHGLGFASVLNDIGLDNAHFVTGLISFNLGLELGQLSVIALCFILVLGFRHKPWYRQRIAIPASAIIALIGAYWFVERTFL